jgi:competence protein ComEA
LVLVLWATQGLCAKKKPPLHPVNLNSATSGELQQVPGIGPATADKILQARKSYGRFKSVNDVEAIREIGAKRLEKMRKYLTVGTPAQGSAAPGPTAAKATQKKTPGAKAAPATKVPPAASEEEEP